MTMFSSTIVATVGRPSLAQTVATVLGQQGAAPFELIVVNDSGRPLPPAAWQQAENVRLIETNRRERCFARNSGAAVARGQYLHFLDDDDWLLPGALAALGELAATRPQSAWLLGAANLVDRGGRLKLTLRHQMAGNLLLPAMAGEWLPLQASFIQTDAFFAAGGFDPAVVGGEDVDLARRLTRRGEVAVTPAVVAAVTMGEAGSTTDKVQARQRSQRSRETVLDDPAAFRRMAATATDAFWHGRLSRIYLTSAYWNVKQRRFFTALSRGWRVGVSLLLARGGLGQKAFWQAVATPYQSVTFAAGAAAAEG